MNSQQALLALHLSGVIGPRRVKSARGVFSDVADIFGASEEQLSRLPDWTASCAQKVLSLKDPAGRVEQEPEKAEAQGVTVLVEEDPEFPKVFKNLYDPPFVLW